MNNKSMVSVIIPTYNRQDEIKRSIESVLTQTYKNLEILVIDDGSTDNTKAVVQSIEDSRIKYIYQEHKGACAARNTGIAMSEGEFIAFQDSDDVWHNNKLETQINVLLSENADVCFCGLYRYYPNELLNCKFPDVDFGSGFVDRNILIKASVASTQCIVAKKPAFQDELFDPNVIKAQDWDWVIRASKGNKFYFLNKILVDQFISIDSITTQYSEKTIENWLYMHKKYMEEKEDAFKRFHLSMLLSAAKDTSLLGKDGSGFFLQAFAIDNSIRTLIKALLSKMRVLKRLYELKGI